MACGFGKSIFPVFEINVPMPRLRAEEKPLIKATYPLDLRLLGDLAAEAFQDLRKQEIDAWALIQARRDEALVRRMLVDWPWISVLPVLIRDQDYNVVGLGPEVAIGARQPIYLHACDYADE